MSSVLATLVISPELCDKAGGRGSIILLYPYLSGQQWAPFEKRRLLLLTAEAVYIKGRVLVGVQPTFTLLPLTTTVGRMEEVVAASRRDAKQRRVTTLALSELNNYE
jgi:hypothetical protein